MDNFCGWDTKGIGTDFVDLGWGWAVQGQGRGGMKSAGTGGP